MQKICLAGLAAGIALLANASSLSAADPLGSWNDGTTKSEIIDFVAAVSDASSDKFVEVEDRIAVLDNDGTLWVEKPLYAHAHAVFAELKRQIEADPSLLQREPWKSVASKDLGFFE